jgi:hypothetical protein
VTSRSEFTKEKGLALQANTVTLWAAKLRSEVFEALRQRIKAENDNLPKDANGYDVFRGDQITNAVIDLRLRDGKWVGPV